MSIIAAAVQHMLAAGMPHEAIVSAVEAMENQAPTMPVRTARQERNRRYYEKKKASDERLKASESDGQDANKTLSDGSDAEPRARSRSNNNLPSGDNKNPPSEGKKTTGVVHPLPLNDAFEAWNAMASRAGLQTVRDHSPPRVRALRARLNDVGMDGWLQTLGTVAASAFLTGQNDRGWRASFDFVVKAENFTKIREGVYSKPGERPAEQQAAKPKPAWFAEPTNDEDWRRCLSMARQKGGWFDDEWGPPPYSPGCRVPAHLLGYDDNRNWSRRKFG